MTAIVLADSFDRPDSSLLGTSDTGQPWTMKPGFTGPEFGPFVPSVIGVAGNRAAAGNANMNVATMNHGTPDVTIGVDVITPFPQGHGAGIIFRWELRDRYWQGLIARSILDAAFYRIYMRLYHDNGAHDDYDTHDFATLADGAHRMEIRAHGADIEMWFDGVHRLGTVSSLFSDQREHGISTYFSTAVRLDNYRANGVRLDVPPPLRQRQRDDVRAFDRQTGSQQRSGRASWPNAYLAA